MQKIVRPHRMIRSRAAFFVATGWDFAPAERNRIQIPLLSRLSNAALPPAAVVLTV